MRLTRIAQSLSPRHKSAPHRAFARSRGRSGRRWTLITALVTIVAGIVVAAPSAASFDDTKPCPTPNSQVFECPDGEVGKPYSIQLVGHDGCDLYRFEVDSGSLPQGLSLSPSGVISGVPQGAGKAHFYLEIHDLLPSEGGHPGAAATTRPRRSSPSASVLASASATSPCPRGWWARRTVRR